jgi:hypothetical protein
MNIPWTGVNLWAVLAGTVASMMLGWLWYSVLFDKAWIKLMGWKKEDIRKADVNKAMAQTIVWAIVKAYGMALLVSAAGVQGVVDGLILGALVSAVIVLPTIGTNYAFEARPPALLAITVGNHAASLLALGAILGAWR